MSLILRYFTPPVIDSSFNILKSMFPWGLLKAGSAVLQPNRLKKVSANNRPTDSFRKLMRCQSHFNCAGPYVRQTKSTLQ